MFRITLAVSAVLLVAGCGGIVSSELAIYDWEAQRTTGTMHGAGDLICEEQACPDLRAKRVYVLGSPKLSGTDFDRANVRAEIDPQTGNPVVVAFLTQKGEKRFEDLTRKLAERGARMGSWQHVLLVIDDVVYASPAIDYTHFPDGLPGDSGIAINVDSLNEAKKLARALRGD